MVLHIRSCRNRARGRGLALRPKVLLLDEPTANVDAASALALAHAVQNCTAEGMTVVCATHDPALVRALAARQIRLGKSWDMDADQ